MKKVALGYRLKKCRGVITLGVRPNFSDYSPTEQDQIKNAETIYYPSEFYADLLHTMGIRTFPEQISYHLAQDKIKQTALFELLGLPHPKTRVFYGRGQQEKILEQFTFPFIAKIPRGSSMGRGVFFIENQKDLEHYCNKVHAAYIQSYLPIEKDMRFVVIGKKIALSYTRVTKAGEFRSNVARGARIRFDLISKRASDLALETALSCHLDDVGLDICEVDGEYFVLEANMRYGREGFKKAGIDYTHLMESFMESGQI